MKAVFLNDIVKGIIIGVANIAPGVSGSALSISMGVYDRIVGAVSDFPKAPRRSLKNLLPFGIGAMFGVVALSFLLEFLFAKWPVQMHFLFLGLVAGCIPTIWQETKTHQFRLPYGIGCLLCFLMVLLPGIFGGATGEEVLLSAEPAACLKLFLIGILAAVTLIVPGVSGTLLLTAMGYYVPLLHLINGTVSAAASFDLKTLCSNLVFLFPLGVGVLLGGYLISRFMTYLLSRRRGITYWAIFGVVLASPVVMVWNMGGMELSWESLFPGILCMGAGACLSVKLGQKS